MCKYMTLQSKEDKEFAELQATIDNQAQRIAELEGRLAEKEYKIDVYMSDILKLMNELKQQDQRIAELESALEFEMNTTRKAIREKNQRIAELESRLAEMADLADEQLDDLVTYIQRLQVGLSRKRKELSDE